ncbi:MAG: hypothetical protein ACI9RY_001516 [Reinekea sp.]|jgi:hypothetical protein
MQDSVRWRTVILLLSTLCAGTVLADEFDELFSDPVFADIEVEPAALERAPGLLRFGQQLSLRTVIHYNNALSTASSPYHGLTSLVARYRPSFEYQPSEAFSLSGTLNVATDAVFALRKNANWSDAVVSADQYQAGIRHLVGQYRGPNWQLNSGIQTQSLGLADLLSVVNVMYAADLTVPGLADLDETRLPAWTTSGSGPVAGVRVKLGAVHRHQLTRWPTQGSDFDTGLVSKLDRVGLALAAQPLALANMGWFGSVSGVVAAWDWQLTALSQLAHDPVIEIGPEQPGLSPGYIPIGIYYPRVGILAAASSYVIGNLVLKGELAASRGLQAQSNREGQPAVRVNYRQVQGVLGFDLNAGGWGRLVGEVQSGKVLDYANLQLLQVEADTLQWGLAYSKHAYQDLLTLGAQMLGFGRSRDAGRIQALSIDYQLSDHWRARVRLLDYVSGDAPLLQGAGERDRLVLGLHWQF